MSNGFFLVEMIGISAVFNGMMAARAIRTPATSAGGRWERFGPLLTGAALTLLFAPIRFSSRSSPT